MKIKFSQNFEKYTNFTKIRLVGPEVFHVDRQTGRQADVTKLTVAFSNFENAPNNAKISAPPQQTIKL